MLGDNIRRRRKAQYMSINQLAHRTGLSLGYLSELERNKAYNPTMEVMEKIAKVLGCYTSDLFENEEDPTSIAEKQALKEKEKNEIGNVLRDVEHQLLTAEELMFDGEPASPEAVQSVLDAMRIGMEIAKKRNKENFVP